MYVFSFEVQDHSVLKTLFAEKSESSLVRAYFAFRLRLDWVNIDQSDINWFGSALQLILQLVCEKHNSSSNLNELGFSKGIYAKCNESHWCTIMFLVISCKLMF